MISGLERSESCAAISAITRRNCCRPRFPFFSDGVPTQTSATVGVRDCIGRGGGRQSSRRDVLSDQFLQSRLVKRRTPIFSTSLLCADPGRSPSRDVQGWPNRPPSRTRHNQDRARRFEFVSIVQPIQSLSREANRTTRGYSKESAPSCKRTTARRHGAGRENQEPHRARRNHRARIRRPAAGDGIREGRIFRHRNRRPGIQGRAVESRRILRPGRSHRYR